MEASAKLLIIDIVLPQQANAEAVMGYLFDIGMLVLTPGAANEHTVSGRSC